MSRALPPAFRDGGVTWFGGSYSSEDVLALLSGELGADMLRLLLADRSCERAALVCRDRFDRGATLVDAIDDWAMAVGRTGARVEVLHLDDVNRVARVAVHAPWEAAVQSRLSENQKWGCAILWGELTAIFSDGFGSTCHVEERAADGEGTVWFDIAVGGLAIPHRLVTLRAERASERERQVAQQLNSRLKERLELDGKSRELVRQRTRVLREEILARERSELMKDELVSTVSHELRTPLTSIVGFTELLLDHDFSAEQQRRYIGIMHTEARRLSRLIDDFLDLQKIESGASWFELVPTDLGPLVRGVAEVFGGSSRQIEIEVPDGLPMVLADGERISQLLSNLLSNAIKYSPDGEPVSLSVEVATDQVVVRVTDRGVGIPKGAIANLFDKFYRVRSERSNEIGGTGLGLAIAKNIVDSHDGAIRVESVLGEGSTFIVTLPVMTQCVDESS